MSEKNSASQRKITSKQIVAWIGIILLLALYIITLLVAIFDTSSSGKLFALCLFATVAIPILIWIYTWMYGKLTGRHTIADFDAGTDKDDPCL
jgi:amino acid transporter